MRIRTEPMDATAKPKPKPKRPDRSHLVADDIVTGYSLATHLGMSRASRAADGTGGDRATL
jgi:hypothetical protein